MAQTLQINERLVKISAGYITTDESLELGTDISLLVKGTVTKIEDHDNQDGTINRIYVVKGEITESLSE